ncbi:MAG: hypothetical protein HOQ24_10270 [Mycobacteriaceae bacterium]|nr:hypothetical protein [Mycobacteriaceae bacterium]
MRRAARSEGLALVAAPTSAQCAEMLVGPTLRGWGFAELTVPAEARMQAVVQEAIRRVGLHEWLEVRLVELVDEAQVTVALVVEVNFLTGEVDTSPAAGGMWWWHWNSGVPALRAEVIVGAVLDEDSGHG